MRKSFDPGESVHRQPEAETHFKDAGSDGLFGSLQSMLVALLSVLANRVELFAVEFQEARLRALFILGWSVALIFFSFFGVITLVCLLVFFLAQQGFVVLITASVFFSLAAVACFCVARNKLKVLPFAETVNQLRKDREMASGENVE
ncbi:MAG: phage holin family protein [Verrucomicrobiota bacterium]